MSQIIVAVLSLVIGLLLGHYKESLMEALTGHSPDYIPEFIFDTTDNRVAVHESGHTVCAWHSPYVAHIDHITLTDISGNDRAVFTFLKSHESDAMWDNIVISMGGIAAEAHLFKTFRSGPAKEDLIKARDLAKMLAARAMGPEPGALFCPWDIELDKNTLDISKMLRSIKKGSQKARILNLCYQRAKQLIKQDEKNLRRITRELLKKGELQGSEVNKIFGHARVLRRNLRR